MPRLRTATLPVVIGATALLAAACSSDGPSASNPYGGPAPAASTPAATTPAAVGPTTTLALSDSRLGSVVVDGRGRTVYLFEQDTSDQSTCYGACATSWPPLLTSGDPAAGIDLSHADLGTTTRKDGTEQVTYHGHPLYLFSGDLKPGDASGQGIDAFGATWYVVGADGRRITTM